MLYIFDNTETLITTLPKGSFFDAVHREVLNGENTFQFTISANSEHSEHVVEGNLVAFRDLDSYWQVFEIKRLVDVHGDDLTRTAYCEHIFYELLDDVVTDKRPSADATAALAGMLEGTRWQVGIVDDLGASSTSAYYESALSAVQKVANAWKGELNWRCVIEGGVITRYVDLLAMRGTDTGKQFVYSKDILSIEREVDTSGVVTALYGRGKGVETESGAYGRRLTFADIEAPGKPLGQEWIGDNDALARWGRNGRHRFGLFIDEEETDPVKLLEKTRAELAKRTTPRVTYRLDVVSLEELTGYEHEAVRLGDLVRVIDREFKPELVVSARVIDIERDILDPANTKVVLGSFAPTIVEATINTARRVNDMANRPFNTKWLDGKISVLQNEIENVQSCVFQTADDGILILDAPTYDQATKAMKLGGGIFAIANQKDGQGGWNWRTFGTGSGFTADEINAGKIRADLVEIGPDTTFAPGYDPSQIEGGAQMGIDSRCTALFHFDDSLNSHKGLTPTFTRNSVAYLSDGTQVPAGQPRFEQGKFGQGVFIEEDTTNLLSSSQGGTGVDLTKWGQSWGVTVTQEGDWYRLTNNQASSGFIRGYVDLSKLINGETYTCSLELFNDGATSVAVFLDWCDRTGTSVLVNPGERKKVVATGLRAEYTSIYRFMDINMLYGNSNILARFPQVERKSYPTSFIDGTRQGDIFYIETQGVMDVKEGTISIWVYIDDVTRRIDGNYNIIFGVLSGSGADGWFVLDHSINSSDWRLALHDGVGSQVDLYTPDSDTPNGWHNFVVTWSDTENTVKLYIDGVKKIETQKSGAFPTYFDTHLNIGHLFGNRYLNTKFDELAIFNYAVTDSEISAWYNAKAPFYSSEGQPQLPGYLKAETDGLKVYDSNDALRVLVGSWVEDAIRKYGIKIIDGEIYSSLIRSGTEEASSYIQFVPPNKLEVRGASAAGTKLLMLEIIAPDSPYSSGIGGIINFYLDGVFEGQIQLSYTGLWISSVKQPIHLSAGAGIKCYGNFDMASGTKNNIEQTENFGQRALTVRESPEQKYVDEGFGILTDGVCRVDIDPIFMECIEPHTMDSKWHIHLTPYDDVSLYVAEIGDSYFIVKERNSGNTTGAEFTWSLSATRKNYAHIRFMEVNN